MKISLPSLFHHKKVLFPGVILVSILLVPIFSLFFWYQLTASINKSEELSAHLNASLNLISELESLALAESRLVRSFNDFIATRESLFFDAESSRLLKERAAAMRAQAASFRQHLPQHLPPTQASLEGILEFARLLPRFNELDLLAVQDADIQVQNHIQVTIRGNDDFAELDSLLEEALLELKTHISAALIQPGLEGIKFADLITGLMELESLCTQIRHARQAYYLDNNIASSVNNLNARLQSAFASSSSLLPHSSSARQHLMQGIRNVSALLQNRYLPRIRLWISEKTDLEIGISRLLARIEFLHGSINSGLGSLSAKIRRGMDTDISKVYGARENVQTGIGISGAMLMVLSLSLVGLIIMVLVRMSRANQLLSDQVRERTQELAMANQELKARLADLQATQNQLINSEKMASLAGLVTGVAHEINTPLGVALTASSFMEEKTKELSLHVQDENFKSALELLQQANGMALRNLERTADLVKSFRQISIDQTQDDIKSFNLNDYLINVVMSIKPSLTNKSTQIIQSIDPRIHMRSYAGALSQIISNLILNADLHGLESVAAGEIRIAGTQTGNNVQLIISDNGKGIAPDDQGKLFEPFFTTKRSQGRPGLGLFTVKNLVFNKMQGSITLIDTEGKGTSFQIDLPMEILPKEHK